MKRLKFKQVDVFTRRPFFGNPVAVVFGADELPAEQMQRIARWTNLSETVFVLRSTKANYRLRIFSPGGELPFAGHPTIGAAHAVREAGLVPGEARTFVQECAAGEIPLTVDEAGNISARVPTPKLRREPVDARKLSAALGGVEVADPLVIDVGAVWLVARLGSVGALDGLTMDGAAVTALSRELRTTGVTVYALDEQKRGAAHVRSFAPAAGVPEDPVCGSGNASVAAHQRVTGAPLGERYTAYQGKALGRDGTVEVRLAGEEVHIGGPAVTVVEGELAL